MRKVILILCLLGISISSLFGVAGFGLSVSQSLYSVGANTKTIGSVSFGNKEFSNGIGLGGYVYIDAIPFIDLDLEFNGFASKYDFDFTLNNITTSYSLPFGSISGYLTLQKKLLQLKIPLLAKAKLTVGAGLSSQTYKSIPDQTDLEELLGSSLEGATETPNADKLKDFIKNNTASVTGFHIQTGIQFKVLMIDSFLYYRQVFAEDVIPDGKVFGSLNLRLGMGF